MGSNVVRYGCELFYAKGSESCSSKQRHGRVAIRHTDGHFVTEDDIALFYRQWSDETTGRAAIAVVHGYGEHSGRYERLARRLVPLGYSVYACDLRGHGLSPGRRGHIERFSEYLLDTAGFLRLVRTQERDRPLILLGHSLGGLIAARYAQDPAVDLPGMVLSSPFLRLKLPVPAWKTVAASALSRFAPALPMPSGLPLKWISHDTDIVEETRRDPLSHRCTTPRWFTETVAAQVDAVEHASNHTENHDEQ